MVTGHRPSKLGGYRTPNPTEQWVRSAMHVILERLQAREEIIAITGMAIGADQMFCEVALDIGLPVWAAVPFEGQGSQWPDPVQRHYRDLLAQCSEVHHVSGPGYTAHKMRLRNRWMVERADYALAVWDGSSGGTGHTVGLLRTHQVPTIHLDPARRVVSKLDVA